MPECRRIGETELARPYALTPDHVRQYRENGHVHLRGILSKAQIAELRDVLKSVTAERFAGTIRMRDRGGGRLLPRIHADVQPAGSGRGRRAVHPVAAIRTNRGRSHGGQRGPHLLRQGDVQGTRKLDHAVAPGRSALAARIGPRPDHVDSARGCHDRHGAAALRERHASGSRTGAPGNPPRFGVFFWWTISRRTGFRSSKSRSGPGTRPCTATGSCTVARANTSGRVREALGITFYEDGIPIDDAACSEANRPVIDANLGNRLPGERADHPRNPVTFSRP